MIGYQSRMDLDTLNAGQRAAVTAPDGVQLVVAGAGTGKTRTLVHRVAWLLEERKAGPRDIVLLTFTRRAANEMLGRASQLVGHEAYAVRGGTFHSYAVQALRRYADKLGFTRDFTILDRGDSESLVGIIRSELGLGGQGRRFPQRRTVLKVLSKQINTGRDVADIVDSDYPQYFDHVGDIEEIGRRFAARKRAQNVMDFDDLLVHLVTLMGEHPEARERLADAVKYLLVDEYQDTNHIQALIARGLHLSHGNLMVVGDEAQSIYGFRGADVRNILHFQEQFPTATLLRLEQNYRSTQRILDLANGVLDTAREGYDKTLFSDLGHGDSPLLVEVADETDQADCIVERVLELREKGVPMKEMAVLFRSGFHANVLELALARADIPFRKFGGIQFIEAAHVKDVFALLRIVANPKDALAWYRVLQWFDGVGSKTAEKVIADIEETGVFDVEPYRKRKYGGAFAYLAGVVEDAQPLTADLPALMEHLVEYYTPIMEQQYEDHRKRGRDLETLAVLAQRYDDLEGFLADVSLDPPSSADARPTDNDDEFLTLSTIHSAKGLEWDTVWVLQLGDGHFPSGQSLDDDDAMEEERRLFYVAVTRAKRRLELLQPRMRHSRWGSSGAPGCALLDEIPDLRDLVEPVRWAPAPLKPGRSVEKHPDVAAAEQRLADFLAFFDKKKG